MQASHFQLMQMMELTIPADFCSKHEVKNGQLCSITHYAACCDLHQIASYVHGEMTRDAVWELDDSKIPCRCPICTNQPCMSSKLLRKSGSALLIWTDHEHD